MYFTQAANFSQPTYELNRMKHQLILKSITNEHRVADFTVDSQPLNCDAALWLLGMWQAISTSANSSLLIQIQTKHQMKRTKTGTYSAKYLSISELTDRESSSQKFIRHISLFRVLFAQMRYGHPTTVRDIFYRDVQLYGRQQNLNHALKTISQSLHLLLQTQCGISPSAKGLV